MKKTIALLLSLCFILLAGCSGGESDTVTDNTDPDTYVGAGLLTSLKVLLYSNENFVNNVFICGTLDYDKDKRTETDSGTYYSVVSDSFKSLSELEAAVRSTYTEEAANKLLSDGKYIQSGGDFAVDGSKLTVSATPLAWDIEAVQAKMTSDTECELSVPSASENSESETATVTAVLVDGVWLLDDIYDGQE